MKALEAKLVNGLFWFCIAAVFVAAPAGFVGGIIDVFQAVGFVRGRSHRGGQLVSRVGEWWSAAVDFVAGLPWHWVPIIAVVVALVAMALLLVVLVWLARLVACRGVYVPGAGAG